MSDFNAMLSSFEAQASAPPKKKRKKSAPRPPPHVISRLSPPSSATSPSSQTTYSRLTLLCTCIDDLPHLHIWQRYASLLHSTKSVSVRLVIHAKNPAASPPEVLKHCLPWSRKPQWGSVELTQSMIDLLTFAVSVSSSSDPAFYLTSSPSTPPPASEDLYCFISESCLPFFPPPPKSTLNLTSTPNNGYAKTLQFSPYMKASGREECVKGDQWGSLDGSWASLVVDWWKEGVWNGESWVEEEGLEEGLEEEEEKDDDDDNEDNLEKEDEEDKGGATKDESDEAKEDSAPPAPPHRPLPSSSLVKILYSKTTASDELWLGNTLVLLGLVSFVAPSEPQKNPVGDRTSAGTVDTVSEGDFNKGRLTAVDWSESAKNPKTVGWTEAAKIAEKENTAFARKVKENVDGEEWEKWIKKHWAQI
mmetsp:Transcript_25068/g.52057  ORF Transcript_25068/g.52057 Transcript_25068/m.52057 type:complete len:419 (-) Transcript_25068:40-1296(-)